jgi:primosomal protein N' (replication factor Y)
MTNPGLIIVDEEHENSYKQQDPSPRYNARDMAVVMGARLGIPVLLGSATPSFESFMNASMGKYGFVKLTKRHGTSKMPQIVIADIQDAYKRRRMKSMLTPELYNSMVTALENNEQIVLFQNRRGYSPYTECMDCGWIPMCKNCDVSLTYHKKSGWLTCHYCGYHVRMPSHCDRCNSTHIKTRGMGTEKVEDEIATLFPEARIARMDLDTTRSKHAFEKMIRQLESRKIDIVIGTQMVTKGLDIQHISLVGILNADNLLNFPDFRAHERAFQLMQQVSGRSGRRDKEGKVVIQTSQTGHRVIDALTNQDYEKFFRESMAERKTFFYPPWYRLIRIIVKHRNQSNVDSGAQFLADLLRKNVQIRVLGPEYPLIGRIQLWYTKEIWMKFSRDRKGPELKENIREAMARVKSLPGNSGLVIHVDVDPM